MWRVFGIHQSHVGFVNYGGSLERLPRPLLGDFASGEFAKLIINQRQQLLGGLGIAGFDGV